MFIAFFLHDNNPTARSGPCIMFHEDHFFVMCQDYYEDDFMWCAGMIKGETEGDEATRAVVEAAKAVAGGQ